jgi:prevent-host-death family protein
MLTSERIRPVSDMRNKFSEIAKLVEESDEPIYLTKNGYGKMVLMDADAFERMNFVKDIENKLLEAELEAKKTKKRFTHKQVLAELGANEKI